MSYSVILLILVCVLVPALAAVSLFLMRTRIKNAELKARLDSSDHRLEDLRLEHEKSLSEIRKTHDESLNRELNSVRAAMTAETEKLLKQREEELSRKAEKTFADISGNLGKNMADMQKAFEENKKTQIENSAALRERFDGAVRGLEQHTKDIGNKADNLANALRGQNKLQGNWGEAHLENTLNMAGLKKDTDYLREVVFPCGLRADCILRVDDEQDIILDSKVSLTAYVEYIETPVDKKPEREAALKRHIASIRNQVDILSKKDYARNYDFPGRKTLEYVLMYVPNHPALDLAMDNDHNLWRDAYEKKVYIVSDQTLFLTLHLIYITKRNIEQIRNQEKIIAAAQDMIERVADFASAHAKMGEKLAEAQKQFNYCDAKLRDSGVSITVSARKVMKLGVPVSAKKKLPVTTDEEVIENIEIEQ